MYDENKAKSGLASLLRERRIILMVGAGCSIPLYPSWDGLIEELRRKFAPTFSRGDSESILIFADRIKMQALSGTLGEQDYCNFLRDRFQLNNQGQQRCEIHDRLVRMGYAGIVTTNYESCLEAAATALLGRVFSPLDLSDQDMFDVLRFLRSLSNRDGKPDFVLHLHGHWKDPGQIVLSRGDFSKNYGIRMSTDSSLQSGFQGSIPVEGARHYKVLWSLATMHPILFVGFGGRDEYFLETLRHVQDAFKSGTQGIHYILTHYTSEDDRETSTREWQSKGISPVFYHAPPANGDAGALDHRGLLALVEDVGRLSGVDFGAETVVRINESMTSL